ISKTVVHDVQSFESRISDPALLSIAARNLDRNLLNELTRNEWRAIAKGMQKALTDQVIDAAVHKMPAEVYAISGEEISAKLKSRRNQLADVADKYYKILASEVTIAGSDKKEFFNITRSSDSTLVTIFKIDKDETIDKLLYKRNFSNKETNEINLFALSGKDSVTVQGNSSIKIRVIGGTDPDAIITSNDRGRTLIYDDKNENNTIVPGDKTAIRTSTKPYVNDYATEYFTYDQKGKIPALNYNGEDGIFLGAGYSSKHYGFRKEPFSYNQQIAGAYAPKTGAYYVRMFANIYSIFGQNNDLIFKAGYNGPKYTFNYYGEGNSTVNIDDDRNYYRVRTKNFSTSLFYQHRFSKTFQVGIGPGYEYYRIEKPADKFITSDQFPDKADIESPSNYGTLRSYANINFVDDNTLPSSGLRWKNEANLFKGIDVKKDQFLQLKSEISFYGTPNLNIPFTFALRLGGATNIGSYKFFQANALGNNTYVRGFRNNRFSGRSYLFENTEVRFKVTNLRNYILTGNIGVFGFFDSGRVFSDNPEGKDWHNGYGPGLWVNLYNKFMVTGSYGLSKEGNYITVKSGFYF
ncbi:MAG: metallophosphoesterase, partial [Daejeonella sp.]|nr:metallophosphoesterase [Daejeonella sp.]